MATAGYDIGSRCPTCRWHMTTLVWDEFASWMDSGQIAHSVSRPMLRCPNGHGWPVADRWLASPRPTVVYEP